MQIPLPWQWHVWIHTPSNIGQAPQPRLENLFRPHADQRVWYGPHDDRKTGSAGHTGPFQGSSCKVEQQPANSLQQGQQFLQPLEHMFSMFMVQPEQQVPDIPTHVLSCAGDATTDTPLGTHALDAIAASRNLLPDVASPA